MLGVYDFCGHYDWTFAWLEREAGTPALRGYWVSAISEDAQAHARAEFAEGFPGMLRYWGHTLLDEGAGYSSGVHETDTGRTVMRLDMHACPSKGFLLRNRLRAAEDYCDHCVGWIGPALADAGFVTDHEHDHAAHCWWEIRPAADETEPAAPGRYGDDDVRLLPHWRGEHTDLFRRATGPDDKVGAATDERLGGAGDTVRGTAGED